MIIDKINSLKHIPFKAFKKYEDVYNEFGEKGTLEALILDQEQKIIQQERDIDYYSKQLGMFKHLNEVNGVLVADLKEKVFDESAKNFQMKQHLHEVNDLLERDNNELRKKVSSMEAIIQNKNKKIKRTRSFKGTTEFDRELKRMQLYTNKNKN